MYEYAAVILRVVDGDTVHADVDLGCDVHERMKLRLTGINAPELSMPEGPAARAHLIALLGSAAPGLAATPVIVRTEKDRTEKYGRYLATLIVGEIVINAAMVADGYAVPYMVGR